MSTTRLGENKCPVCGGPSLASAVCGQCSLAPVAGSAWVSGPLDAEEAQAVRAIRERKANDLRSFEEWWARNSHFVRDSSERRQYEHDRRKSAAWLVWQGARSSPNERTEP